MALSLVGASYIHKKVKNSLQNLECNKYKELKKKSEKKKKKVEKSTQFPLVNMTEASLLGTSVATKKVAEGRRQPKFVFR